MPTWPSLGSSIRDANSVIEEDLIAAMVDRDDLLRERPFYLPFAEVTNNATSPTIVATFIVFITEADQLTMSWQGKTTDTGGGGTDKAWYKWKIGALFTGNIGTISNSYTQLTAVFTDLSTIVDTEVALTLEMWNDDGAETASAKGDDGPTSYFSQ